MLNIDPALSPEDLLPAINQMWDLSADKIRSIEASQERQHSAPVYTVEGQYTSRGWTEWTQGFQFGSALLQFDATGDEEFLEIGRTQTEKLMAPHVTHFGVHDHGFNNVSTYGALLRLMNEGRIPEDAGERKFYEMALMASGAVQARRWTKTANGDGFIYSFNGPHSLFADTIRSLRALAMAHRLGHHIMDERDTRISLLDRLVQHARTTAAYSVYYGSGRDIYDIRGRVAHESIFNINDGNYRCANSQQGYSPFTTWTRGQAWIIVGYPEMLEFLDTLDDSELNPLGGRMAIETTFREAAAATCEFYIEQNPTDGICYWDTGAPGLALMGDYLDRRSDPFNDFEPVDSSASAIACQGLLRFGNYLRTKGDLEMGYRYFQAGLTVLRHLLQEPYISTAAGHQGLLLHTIYHRPNGWDFVPVGSKIPRGESCMWGDYHLREAALYVQRLAQDLPYYTFFAPVKSNV
jgi:rhamnogalacturonyl hydrolase YesR